MKTPFMLGLIFCGTCLLRASDVQVRLKIAPYEVLERLEHLVVCAEQSDQINPVIFELKSSIADKEKRQVTQIWNSSIREGVYDIIVRDEPNMMGVLRFAGKKVIVKSGEAASLDFDLIYNELVIIPKLVDGSNPWKDGGSFTMSIQEIRFDDQFAQHQITPLHFDKASQKMAARFYFVGSTTYRCILRSAASAGEGHLESKELFGEIRVSEPIPKVVEVFFTEKNKSSRVNQ